MSDDDVTPEHDEVETLHVDVIIPAHEKRGSSSPLFTHTRLKLIERENGRCWVCGRQENEAGPLQAHHHPIERCFAEEIDWGLFALDCQAGHWGEYARSFNWNDFIENKRDIYTFVDDMTVNGLLLCADHHIVGNEGIHTLPFPIFIAQKYAMDGVKFSEKETIHHEF